RVLRHHRVLNVMTHVDPRKRETALEAAALHRN
ncbi:cation-efflux pump, partial [Burkholderia sp. SIMBA_051]